MVWDFASVLCDELGKCKQIFRWSWLCLAAPFAQLMATRQKNHESRARKGTICERTICYNRDLRHEFNLNDRQLNTFVTSAQGFGFRQAGRWTVQHPRWSQVEHCFTCEAGPRTEMVEPALRTMRTARNVARSNISSSTWKYSSKLTYRSWQSPKLFDLQWSPPKKITHGGVDWNQPGRPGDRSEGTVGSEALEMASSTVDSWEKCWKYCRVGTVQNDLARK